MATKHFITLSSIDPHQLTELLELSAKMKASPENYRSSLAGKALAMIFQKPSTRTRVSFQVGIQQLGGYAIVLSNDEIQIGRGETIADTARVLSRYVDGIMARVFADDDVVQLSKYATVPVISGLSDLYHPCQAVADFLTIKESFGDLKGLPITYIGDGNNVTHSLAFATAKLGSKLTVITPKGYEADKSVMAAAMDAAKSTGAEIRLSTDPADVAGSKVVYTDTWASMGQEKEHQKRIKIFAPYQVSEARFAEADDDAIFLHCLPAHRGEEVVDAVADHPRSKIFDQAENRLHTQKAILYTLMA